MEEEVLLQEAQLVNHQVRQKALCLSKQSLSTTLYAYTAALCDLGAVTHFMHEFYDQNGWPEIDAFQKETSPLYWEIVEAYQNLSNYAKDARIFDSYHPRWHDLAYQQVDAVRARVGLKGLKKGLNQEQFREEVLRERACEFGYEEVRFFDLIRWKRADIFSKPLHGLNVYKNVNDGTYVCEEFPLKGGDQSRAWWNDGGFSPIWYLSAFPMDEVNKGYGLVQNPGWE